MRRRCARSSASTIDSSMSGAELLAAEWSLISIIQSTLWRGTNRNHRQREVVDERADSFVAKGRLPCDDGVQSADRRARNLAEAAGARPITPAKSGYQPHPKRIRVRTRFKHLATHGSPTVRIGTKQTFVATMRRQISPTEPWIGVLRRSYPSFRRTTGG
jgi:hypothetical protein